MTIISKMCTLVSLTFLIAREPVAAFCADCAL